MATDEERRFLTTVERLLVRSDEGLRIDWEGVLELVKVDPEITAKIVHVALTKASEVPYLFRVAEVLAGAHAAVSQDDGLEKSVDSACVRLGRRPLRLTFDAGVEEPVAQVFRRIVAEQSSDGWSILVSRRELEANDISKLLVSFSLKRVDRSDYARLRGLRGKCALTFDVGDDPREIIDIASVRDFVAAIHRAMPYFPYFLDMGERASMFLIYFGCLADKDAIGTRDGMSLDPSHPSVINLVARSMLAVGELARTLGDNVESALQAAFEGLPVDMMQKVFAKLATM
jgi:hypothetical protein